MQTILNDPKVRRRGTKILFGSFVTAAASVPTSQVGDAKGVTTRSGTGTYQVALPKLGSIECTTFSLSLASVVNTTSIAQCTYNTATGILTVVVQVSGAAADTTGHTVNFVIYGHDRTAI